MVVRGWLLFFDMGIFSVGLFVLFFFGELMWFNWGGVLVRDVFLFLFSCLRLMLFFLVLFWGLDFICLRMICLFFVYYCGRLVIFVCWLLSVLIVWWCWVLWEVLFWWESWFCWCLCCVRLLDCLVCFCGVCCCYCCWVE